MKPKTLVMLAAMTVMVILGAVFFGQERDDSPVRSGELVFPQLMESINDVTEMTIQTKEESVTLVRGETEWSVTEKGGYAAALEKIKPVLIGIAELKIREPKTKNPDLYKKLGLQDYDAEDASSSLINIKAKDVIVATMLLGNQRPSKSDPSLSEMYIRKPGDPQTWLVIGKLPIEKKAGEWLAKDLVNVIAKRVRRAHVTHPGGETLVVYKDTPDALDFKIQDLPKGEKVSSQFNVNNVASSLGQLTIDDVKKADELEFDAKSGVNAVLETFDGLRLTVETMKKSETTYGKLAAAFDPGLVYKASPTESSENKEDTSAQSDSDEKDGSKEGGKGKTGDVGEKEEKAIDETESILRSEEEVQKEVNVLQAKLNNWVFELPKFRVDNFSKKKKDLISKE